MDTLPITTRQTAVLTPEQDIKLRNAAKQFEAMLLGQLTSALNNVESGEDSLFGTDGGADLAKKLFSEQLATAMADSGGIGLANTILKEFGLEPERPVIRNRSNPSTEGFAVSPGSKNSGFPFINKSGVTRPVIDPAALAELEIVATDEIRNPKAIDDDAWRNVFDNPANGIDYTIPENQIVPMPPTPVPTPSANSYSMPVEGRISSRFGSRFHPIDRTQKFHGGIDIAAPSGTPIGAAADGVVVFAGERGGYGNMVEIQHSDGRLTRYAHADTIGVTIGQKVAAGEQIATVGSTGKATGPHLHFEVLENGEPVNPFEVLSKVLRK